MKSERAKKKEATKKTAVKKMTKSKKTLSTKKDISKKSTASVKKTAKTKKTATGKKVIKVKTAVKKDIKAEKIATSTAKVRRIKAVATTKVKPIKATEDKKNLSQKRPSAPLAKNKTQIKKTSLRTVSAKKLAKAVVKEETQQSRTKKTSVTAARTKLKTTKGRRISAEAGTIPEKTTKRSVLASNKTEKSPEDIKKISASKKVSGVIRKPATSVGKQVSAAASEVHISKVGGDIPLKIFLPREYDAESDLLQSDSYELPSEYGENELLLMVVDPNVIYAGWELVVRDFPTETEGLTIRIYDITGVEFDGSNARRQIDIKVGGRVASGFFEIGMSGSDILAEIGVLRANGEFRPLVRSAIVSVPRVLVYDELGIAEKLFASGIPVGY